MDTDTKKYLGIDIAGAGRASESGVAAITDDGTNRKYHFPRGDWTGTDGLAELAKLAHDAIVCAVDQPFSYAQATTRLLLNTDNARGNDEVSAYCSRRTDKAMRSKLTDLGLSTNYVMSPNRCQNIWRALALAKLLELTREEVCSCKCRAVETHPRVAWSVLLADRCGNQLRSIIKGYKSGENPESESEYRLDMLRHFECASGICPSGDSDEKRNRVREMATASADSLEALLCAYVACLHNNNQTELYGFTCGIDEDTLKLEGAAVLPKKAWSHDNTETST
ncbi:MAG: DUF429 domain-containing protein [Planctomycetota bacterium]